MIIINYYLVIQYMKINYIENIKLRRLIKILIQSVILIILTIYYILHQLDSSKAIIQFILSQIILIVTLNMNLNEEKNYNS